jgi:hypothetical protein
MHSVGRRRARRSAADTQLWNVASRAAAAKRGVSKNHKRKSAVQDSLAEPLLARTVCTATHRVQLLATWNADCADSARRDIMSSAGSAAQHRSGAATASARRGRIRTAPVARRDTTGTRRASARVAKCLLSVRVAAGVLASALGGLNAAVRRERTATLQPLRTGLHDVFRSLGAVQRGAAFPGLQTA